MRLLWCAAVVAAISCSPGARAQEHAGHQHEASAATNGAPIVVTINPEARVSATWFGPSPPTPACGSAVEIAVAVDNQGFVTSVLQAEVVGPAPPGVTLRPLRQPLSGRPTDARAIELTVREPGPADITVEFSIPHERPDPGGRARVHFLLGCRP